MKRSPLRRKTPLRAKAPAKRSGGGLKAKPLPIKRRKRLRPKKETIDASQAWKAAVFAAWGPFCYLHRLRDPGSQVLAIDPAHILKRSKLGAAIAYGPKGGPPDPELGRPLCRPCHEKQELGLDPEYRFPLADRIAATMAHNRATKGKHWPLPTE